MYSCIQTSLNKFQIIALLFLLHYIFKRLVNNNIRTVCACPYISVSILNPSSIHIEKMQDVCLQGGYEYIRFFRFIRIVPHLHFAVLLLFHIFFGSSPTLSRRICVGTVIRKTLNTSEARESWKFLFAVHF